MEDDMVVLTGGFGHRTRYAAFSVAMVTLVMFLNTGRQLAPAPGQDTIRSQKPLMPSTKVADFGEWRRAGAI